MIMTGTSRMCFTLLLLTSFCRASRDERQTDTEEIFKTPRDKTVQSDFSGSKFPWNCTYKVNSTSGFRSGRVTKDMLDNGRLFSVYVKYKLYDQDDRETEYINQAFFRSIVNGTKSWQVRLIKPKKERVSDIVENALMDSIALLDFTLVQFSIEASCTSVQFTSNSNTTSNQRENSDFFPDSFKQKILHITRLGGKICDGEDEKTQNQTCYMITDFKRERTKYLFLAAVLCFIGLFTLIGPAVVCLFPATEVTSTISSALASTSTVEDGDTQIVVAWQSPIGVRSLIANSFFCAYDTIWNRTKRFIARVFVLPVLFLFPAVFVEYLHYNYILPRHNFLNIMQLSSCFKLNVLCYSCYCIHAFLCSFMIRKPRSFEDMARSRKFLLLCDFPLKMLIHCRRFWLKPFDIDVRLICSNILIGFMMLLFFFFPYLYFNAALVSPIAVMCSTEYVTFLMAPRKTSKTFTSDNVVQGIVLYFLTFCISWFAAYGGITLLRSAGLGVLLILQVAVNFLLSEEKLPFAILLAFLSHYLWSSYRSFTNRYKELGLVLSERLEGKIIHGKCYRFIPKKLFQKSLEELLPIKSNLCKLISKTVLYLIYFCATLSVTKVMDITPLSKALVVVFMLGSVPKIMACFFEKRNTQKPDDLTNDKKPGHLVEEYLKSTSVINTRTSADDDIFPSLILEPEENLDRFDYSSVLISLTLSLFTTDLMLGFVTFTAFIFYHSY